MLKVWFLLVTAEALSAQSLVSFGASSSSLVSSVAPVDLMELVASPVASVIVAIGQSPNLISCYRCSRVVKSQTRG